MVACFGSEYVAIFEEWESIPSPKDFYWKDDLRRWAFLGPQLKSGACMMFLSDGNGQTNFKCVVNG